MIGAREKVLRFAHISRLGIIILQFAFNVILPDHDAGVFISPLENTGNQSSICDNLVEHLIGGLCKWDAQYFTHISKYGYTYENTLAFYPLYPMIVRYMSMIIKAICFPLNRHSTTLLAALLVNHFCFVKSATVLYDLSKIVLKDEKLAYKAAIFYCVNPASIFFTAFYTESMFAFVSFYVMLAHCQNNPYIYLPIGLSALVRSNGLINLGFPIYSFVKYFIAKVFCDKKGRTSIPYRCNTTVGSLAWLLNILFLSIVPYVLLQIYNYSLFCLGNEIEVSVPLRDYALKNKYLIAGTENPPWCKSSVPISYSYVQKKYWDVGFLSYYNFKQIPNFLLAFPILYIILSRSSDYLKEYRAEIWNLGSFPIVDNNTKNKKYPLDIFVFVVHGLFLTIFCIFFVHIQVSTRLLCSASPLLYWYCAFEFGVDKSNDSEDFESLKNQQSNWRVFLLTSKNRSRLDIVILSYFYGYVIAGCIMFPNFLPWT